MKQSKNAAKALVPVLKLPADKKGIHQKRNSYLFSNNRQNEGIIQEPK
jgi:hypothetical protein